MSVPAELGLRSAYVVSGKVKTSLASISCALAALPSLKQLSGGTKLAYEVSGTFAQVLEVSPAGIRLEYAFDNTPHCKSAALTGLISLLAVLQEDFEPDFYSLYQPLVGALCQQVSAQSSSLRLKRLEREANELLLSNISLARAVLGSNASAARPKEKRCDPCGVARKVFEWISSTLWGT